MFQSNQNSQQSSIRNIIKNSGNGKNIILFYKPTLWKHFLTNNYVTNSSIEQIKIVHCKVTDKQVQVIIGADLKALRELSLWNNIITAPGVKLLMSYNWSELKYLNLSFNKIGNNGCKYIAAAKMDKIMNIFVNDCEIGCKGLRHLAKIGTLSLDRLYFPLNKYNLSGLQTLLAHHSFKKIEASALEIYEQNTRENPIVRLHHFLESEQSQGLYEYAFYWGGLQN